jgi:microcystin-dependent protein
MSEQFLGELRMFGFNFAPQGWALCNGQILSIAQNTALFSLLGTTYGGNGTTNFALPNLQGSVPISSGQGPGLSFYDLGQVGGEQTVTLLQTQMPTHNHSLPADAAAATSVSPGSGGIVAEGKGSGRAAFAINSYSAAATTTNLAPALVAAAGASQPHNNMQPSLVMNWCIAVVGIFPSRN